MCSYVLDLHVVEHEQESTARRRCDRICQKSHIRFLTHYSAATCHSCLYMHSALYKLNGKNKKAYHTSAVVQRNMYVLRCLNLTEEKVYGTVVKEHVVCVV